MSNNFEDYNIVAIGDSDAWQKLGCEVSKIRNCRLLQIPTLQNPYSVTDNYMLRTIFLLPDAITVYQGACNAWIQRLRLGPNVNTPIICIVQVPERNNAEELKQLMQANIINWIITTQEISALNLVRIIRCSQTSIQKCLDTSAGQIVGYATWRAEQLRESRTASVNADGAVPEDTRERTDTTQESKRDNKVAMTPTMTSSITPPTRKRLRDDCANRSPKCTQTQRDANSDEITQKKMSQPNPSQRTKRARLQHKANVLNKKLDRALIYISRVQSLLDRKTNHDQKHFVKKDIHKSY
ncbi:uncharacterized protein LOC119745633 [Patiria miniata]|uniref:Uncharacterized protein n=1 Tax=Patiria miniata TaxID=46514 RepID=A0A914BRH3_PATMI|nr:uncharacterized protein LOC119745633 [Patiria miniata]